MLDAIAALHPLVDETLVVDALARRARRAARTASSSPARPARATRCGTASRNTTGELVAFLDTDTEDFTRRLRAPACSARCSLARVDFVKGHFRRPLKVGDTTHPDEGGRVTELLARPYLNLHFPQLAGFRQPLAGEVAATRDLLERLPFPAGYGVEIAMLIDAHCAVGLERMAQVDLGTRQNRHQPLGELSKMAFEVLAAAEGARTASRPGNLLIPTDTDFDTHAPLAEERPPLSRP